MKLHPESIEPTLYISQENAPKIHMHNPVKTDWLLKISYNPIIRFEPTPFQITPALSHPNPK